jgi:hypothetical protein
MIRILLFTLLSFLFVQCMHRPYKPNYNTSRTHNGEVQARMYQVNKRVKKDIKIESKNRHATKRAKARRIHKRKKGNYSKSRSK